MEIYRCRKRRELPVTETGSPSLFFMPTQINKVIDLLPNDILRGRVRYYIRLPKKASDRCVKSTTLDKSSFAVLSRAIAHYIISQVQFRNKFVEYYALITQCVEHACRQLSSRESIKIYSIARLGGDINRFIAFRERNIDRSKSQCKSLGKLTLRPVVNNQQPDNEIFTFLHAQYLRSGIDICFLRLRYV